MPAGGVAVPGVGVAAPGVPIGFCPGVVCGVVCGVDVCGVVVCGIVPVVVPAPWLAPAAPALPAEPAVCGIINAALMTAPLFINLPEGAEQESETFVAFET